MFIPARIARVRLLTMAVVLSLILGSAAAAAPITVPTDLNPGDSYRLVFASSGARDYTSTNIADYNNFVQSAADRGGAAGGQDAPSGDGDH